MIPEGCTINQMLLLYRHGARYPTSGAGPSTFAQKVHNATVAGFNVTGDLTFLADWTYKLGAELLTPFGRSQNFQLGVEYRQLYGELLNNFTEQDALPVFRTQSQDRMVKTAENFAAGFFGVPEYLNQVNIEILVENSTVNNSGAPYEVCPNSNIATRGSVGSALAAKFANNAFNATLARLNAQVSGALNFTATDAIEMLQLCSYETNALGYSKFCGLFSEEDFINYEYYYDLVCLAMVVLQSHTDHLLVFLLQQRTWFASCCRPGQGFPARVARTLHPHLPRCDLRSEQDFRQLINLFPTEPVHLR